MMARANYPAVLADTLKHEGGFQPDRHDKGNWTGGKVGVGELKGTNKGISAAAFPDLDIRNLSDAEIARIYEAKYWNPVRGDLLPYGVDLATFDAGVMSGPGRAVKWLQKSIGTKVDGAFGPKTAEAMGHAELIGDKIVHRVCDARLGFVKGLTIFSRYGKGWSRRIAGVRAKGVAMWMDNRNWTAALKHDQLERTAEAARKRARAQDTAAKGTAATGGTGVAVDRGTDFIDLLGNGLVLAAAIGLFIFVAYLIATRARINRDTAQAMDAEAAA